MLSPEQAFNAIKILNPEIVTLVQMHPHWQGTHWVHVKNEHTFRVPFRCSAGIDWPEGVAQWPMPEKKWRAATIDDVVPKSPKRCRVRDRVGHNWSYNYELLAVIADDLPFVACHNEGGLHCWILCEVEDELGSV